MTANSDFIPDSEHHGVMHVDPSELTEMEHHASLVTWQQIARMTDADLRYLRVDDDGRLDTDHARDLIGPDTPMVSVTPPNSKSERPSGTGIERTPTVSVAR